MLGAPCRAVCSTVCNSSCRPGRDNTPVAGSMPTRRSRQSPLQGMFHRLVNEICACQPTSRDPCLISVCLANKLLLSFFLYLLSTKLLIHWLIHLENKLESRSALQPVNSHMKHTSTRLAEKVQPSWHKGQSNCEKNKTYQCGWSLRNNIRLHLNRQHKNHKRPILRPILCQKQTTGKTRHGNPAKTFNLSLAVK